MRQLLVISAFLGLGLSAAWATESASVEAITRAEAELARLGEHVEERASTFYASADSDPTPEQRRGWQRDVGRLAARLQQLERELTRLGADPESWRPTVEALRARLTGRVDAWTAMQRAARSFVKTPAGTATIRGTVTRALGGTPIEAALVQIFDQDNVGVSFAETAADGSFVVSDLAAGTYFATAGASTFRGQVFDGVECSRFECFGPSGTPIEVAEGAEVTDIDFDLTGLGRLTGRLTAASSGAPLMFKNVQLRDLDGLFFNSAGTDEDGRYELVLWPGTYTAVTSAFGYQDELYDDMPCPGGAFDGCDLVDGTPIEVVFETTTAGIDFELEELGAISGRLFDAADDTPIPFGSVEAWNLETQATHFGSADGDGFYALGGLAAGDYVVVTRGVGDYVDELYDDMPCFQGPSFGCDPLIGTPVAVELETTTTGIDFGLDLGGEITGRVLAAGSAEPLADIAIVVADATGRDVASTRTDLAGQYVVRGLASGTYYSYATEIFDVLYQSQIYDHRACDGDSCDPLTGDPIEVVEGETTAGIDFDLVPFGVIEGRITEAGTGLGLIANVVAFSIDGVTREGFSDADGNYRIPGLPNGDYTVLARTEGYIGTLYPAIPCHRGDCDVNSGQPVTATLASVVSGIDIALPLGGSISGSVTLKPSPFQAVSVQLFDDQGAFIGEDRISGSGEYRLVGLEAGDYFVTAGAFGHLIEVWDDIVCFPDCDPTTTGDPVAVQLGEHVGNIDFELERLGTLTGSLTDADSGLPIEFAQLNIWDDSGSGFPAAFAFYSFTEGQYISDPLLPGTYYVTSDAFRYRDRIFGGGFCDAGCDPMTGTPIEIGLNATVTGIDMALRREVGIVGKVVDAESGLGVAGIEVEAWTATDQFFYGSTTTGPQGGYSLGVDPGEYYLVTSNDRGADDEVWDDVPCPGGFDGGGCELTDGDPVTVVANTLTPNIDFALEGLGSPCQPSSTAMCLNQGRFRVQATWRNADGVFDFGRVEEITGDTGYFWFFDPDNVEVVVKVLDACVDPFDRFWVFAAGLTDVEVNLTVTDVATGEVQTYENTLGTPFEPVLDTDAFATCGSPAWTPPEPGDASVDLAGEGLSTAASVADSPAVDRARVEKACVGTDDDLCLTDDRFEVEATWRSADGSGQASAVPLTGDTGYFWFFDADNIEIVVKVLDACAAPFNRYWVFATGLTDVELTLTVRDTESGETWETTSPLGEAFEPILDTDAFATCDP